MFIFSVFVEVCHKTLQSRGYSSVSCRVKAQYQANLEKETEGAFKKGHYAKADKDIKDAIGAVMFEGGIHMVL